MQESQEQQRVEARPEAPAALRMAEPVDGSGVRAALGKLLYRAVRALELDNPRLLQLGCGSGTALNYLLGCGLDRLSGICEDALSSELLRQQYPLLFERSRIYSMRPAELLPIFDALEFDLVCLRLSSLRQSGQAGLLEELARISSDAVVLLDDANNPVLPRQQDAAALTLAENGFEELCPLPGMAGTDADCLARLFRRRAGRAG